MEYFFLLFVLNEYRLFCYFEFVMQADSSSNTENPLKILVIIAHATLMVYMCSRDEKNESVLELTGKVRLLRDAKT